MKTGILTLLAETFLHPGSGQGEGAIDLQVAREGPTGYPFIPGSGLKGALRDYCRGQDWKEDEEAADGSKAPGLAKRIFGAPDNAGRLLVGDARLLLLPVRSLTGAYRWVTCPHLVERWHRDLRRARLADAAQPPRFEQLAKGDGEALPPVLTAEGKGRLFLEERLLMIQEDRVPDAVVELLGRAIGDAAARARLKRQLAIVSDDQLAWFARHALAVQARNNLDPTTKTSVNLWYEEALPPDTVLYAVLAERVATESPFDSLARLLARRPYLQLGGNETVGQGVCSVRLLEEGRA